MTGYTTRRWAIVDDEGKPIRFFDYPAEGTVEIKEEMWKVDWDNFDEALL